MVGWDPDGVLCVCGGGGGGGAGEMVGWDPERGVGEEVACVSVLFCCRPKGENVDVKALGTDEESGKGSDVIPE